jgi:ankyrin repeat protein
MSSGLRQKVQDGNALIKAAGAGNIESIQHILATAAGPAASLVEQYGGKALRAAAASGHGRAVEQLLAAGSAFDSRSSEGQTALHAAAQQGSVCLVQLLLSAGAPLESKGAYGCTALQLAAGQGHVEMLDLLLQAGASVTAIDDFCWSALMYAAHAPTQHSSLQCVQRLIAARADVDQQDKEGYTPLHAAAQSGHDQVMSVLLAAGASVNVPSSSGATPLWLAVLCCKLRTVQVLLAAGAAVDLGYADQSTPLCNAAAQAVWVPDSYVIFNCFMIHLSTNPAAAAPSALIQAAFSAADAACWCSSLQEAEVHAGAILRQLLLAAAQQDAAATAAAVHGNLQSPRESLEGCLRLKLLSCVALDLWLCADAELAAIEAQWPAVQQQMLSTVAKARHEPQEGDEAAALSQ